MPGAMDAGLTSVLFWGSLIASLAVAFVVTVPVNHFMIARGKGHAAVHQLHGHEPPGSGGHLGGGHDAVTHGETRGEHDHHRSP